MKDIGYLTEEFDDKEIRGICYYSQCSKEWVTIWECPLEEELSALDESDRNSILIWFKEGIIT
jgi:hypothetical protein